MAIATFADLRTTASNYLHRSDLASQIPDFITLAEWRMARSLRIAPLMLTSTVVIAPGGSTGALPAGYLEMVNTQIAAGTELVYVPPDTIDRVPAGAVPWAYTLLGTSVQIAPAWTAGGNLSATYFRKESALSDSVTTNWYIANAPDTLLYAVLLEAAPYLIDDTRIQIWRDYFREGVDSINRQYGNVDPHKRMLQYNQTGFNANTAAAGTAA